ncbi:MAG: hypothetical protein ACTSV7_10125, partial [Candidatus Baldrarchaeia archaeon]
LKGKSFSKVVDSIPLNLLKFLLFDYFATKLTFSCEKEYFFDWRKPLFEDSRIRIFRDKILIGLEKLGFSVKTYYYVSTGGGRLRDLNYVISPEIQEKLLKVRPALVSGLEEPLKKKCIIYHFLTDRILPFVKPLEAKDEEIINSYRQEYWNRLEDSRLTEEDIKPLVNELSKKGIATKYRGILAKDLPFEVEDEIAYKVFLKKHLISPVISYLLEGKRIQIEVKESKKVELELPSDLVSKEGRLKFFNKLGEFEIKVREFIASKLGKNLEKAQNKNKEIISRLKKWKEEERRLVKCEGEPLINYATFEDYINLITSNWELFRRYFQYKELATKPLTDVNVFARRPLAHFRALTKGRIEIAKEAMEKFLQKIEGEENE